MSTETAFDLAGNASTRNLVHIFNNKHIPTNSSGAQFFDDAITAVLTVAPNYAASLIGSGTNGALLQPFFGNIDFKAYSINFENRAVCVTYILPINDHLCSRTQPYRPTTPFLKHWRRIFLMLMHHSMDVHLQVIRMPGTRVGMLVRM